MSAPRLADVVRLLEQRYPPATAEPWDAVGLVAGDPDAPVRKVLLAVDPVATVVDEALEWGADLVVTHHPLLLRGVHSVAATTFKGALLHRLVRGGCALLAAHTNADAATGGVADALADAFGLLDVVPLVADPVAPLDKHVVFVPVADAEAVVDAMSGAGAGAVGQYERCAWTTTGEGTFTPLAGASPAIGAVGERATVVEARVELVAPRARRSAVVAAMRAAHPYEEPAFDVLELASLTGPTGTGRVGRLPQPTTLRAFAQAAADATPATAQGCASRATPTRRSSAWRSSAGRATRSSTPCAQPGPTSTSPPTCATTRPPSSASAPSSTPPGPGARRPLPRRPRALRLQWPWLALAARDLAADLQALGTTVETRVSVRRTDPWTGRASRADAPS